MRWTRTVLLALALAGCGDAPLSEHLPWADFDPFARPASYTVVRGDTLGEIATAHSVTVDELRLWNGLEGDLIEVDQVLLIWEGKAPAPARKVKRTTPRPVQVVVTAAVVEIREPVKLPSARTAGVLGALDDVELTETFDASLADTHLEVHRERSSAGLAYTGPQDGTAEGTTIDRPEYTGPKGNQFSKATVRAASLRKPAAKRCLAGPTEVVGDYDIAAARGLTADQIRGALDGFIRHTSACIPSGSSGQITVTSEVVVGCDGRVTSSHVVDGGGAPSAVASCVAMTLSYAAFPAHDMPDGLTFHYPVTLRF